MKLNKQISPYYLRITATPNCNLECVYCNPKKEYAKYYMSDNELLDSIKAAYYQGIRTVHFTGGEPTIRPKFVNLVRRIREMGITTINITTNGVILGSMIDKLKDAGVTGVSISLDSLNPEVVKSITGYDVFLDVYNAIIRSCELFEEVVVNMVVLHQNFDEIKEFVEFARKMNGKFIPRFCELQNYGPVYEGNEKKFKKDFISRKVIKKFLQRLGELKVKSKKNIDKYNGHAEYFILGSDKLIVGIIAPYSHKWACARDDCKRIRIGPAGVVKSCVRERGYQLKGISYSEKVKLFKKIIKEKDNKHIKCSYPKQHIPAYKELRFGK